MTLKILVKEEWKVKKKRNKLFKYYYNYYHKTLASFLNLSNNSSTLSTITPPYLLGGSVTNSTSKLFTLLKSKSSNFNFSIGFFLAFMIIGNLGSLGLFNLKSQVNIEFFGISNY